jgi:hypothetical protein
MGVPATNGSIKTNISDMQIGDVIPCRYIASSGAVGTFSELGTCVATEIPVASSATPDGLFYFTKVDKGLLIADRVVQHSISWDTLNAGGFIEGKVLSLGTPSANVLIRSLSGGCAYADANENLSITNQLKGGWPTNNEWDQYIVNSDLNGKVTKGNNNVWNWNNSINSWMSETTVLTLASATNAKRIVRPTGGVVSGLTYNISNTVATYCGFRPVLQYIEDPATTLFY